MARYNRWMNERIYAAAAGLDDAERKRDQGAFFRSVHGTLNHLLLADLLWMGRFTGEPYPVPSLDHEVHARFEALREARAALDERIERWVHDLDAAALSRELRFRSIVGGPRERAMELFVALVHLFNHQTHHRGQITTLLSQAGVDPGVTDLLWLPEANVRDVT